MMCLMQSNSHLKDESDFSTVVPDPEDSILPRACSRRRKSCHFIVSRFPTCTTIWNSNHLRFCSFCCMQIIPPHKTRTIMSFGTFDLNVHNDSITLSFLIVKPCCWLWPCEERVQKDKGRLPCWYCNSCWHIIKT